MLYVLHWRVIMLLCAAGGLAIMTFWILVHPRLFTEPVINSRNTSGKNSDTSVQKKPLPSFVYIPVVLKEGENTVKLNTESKTVTIYDVSFIDIEDRWN
jgi:hypothetical protein